MGNIKPIQELNAELSKHRKLLHRAVGNQILSHINYHHYEIVRIITEINDSASIRTRYSIEGLFDKDIIALGSDFGKMMSEQFLDLEDKEILNGKSISKDDQN